MAWGMRRNSLKEIKGANYRNFPEELISRPVWALFVSPGIIILSGGEGLPIPPDSHQRCPSFCHF